MPCSLIAIYCEWNNEGPEMHEARTRYDFGRMLSVAVISLSLIVGVIVEMHVAPYPSVAASGDIVTPSPAATGTAPSIKTNTGSSAPWGVILGIGAAIAIFIIGGLFIGLRARRDYLDEQARKAAMPRDDD